MNNNLLIILLVVVPVFVLHSSASSRFQVIKQWKYVNFTWPDEDIYKTATANGLYIPENNIIAGVKYHDGYYYVTLPRMRNGVPATLTRIAATPSTDASPALEPFPSWRMQRIDDCNVLQNVQNVEIDARGQLWIVDGGRIETLQQTMPPARVVKCAPKLLIFDIAANRTTTIHHFSESVAAKDGSFLYDLVVDDADGGYAYITDNSATDPGIIVYSVKDNTSWKIRHSKSMQADPTATEFHVNNITISAPISIAGIALGPKIRTTSTGNVVVGGDDRLVYFSPLSSLHLYAINTTVLRNSHETPLTIIDQVLDIGLKESQSVSMIMDNQGVLYYGLLAQNAIARWDSRAATSSSFQTSQRVIARDDKHIEWPNSFTFDDAGNLTVVMNRLNHFIHGKLDLNEANFRLISSTVGGKSYLFDDENNYTYRHQSEQQDGGEMVSKSSNNNSAKIEPTSTSRGGLEHITMKVISEESHHSLDNNNGGVSWVSSAMVPSSSMVCFQYFMVLVLGTVLVI